MDHFNTVNKFVGSTVAQIRSALHTRLGYEEKVLERAIKELPDGVILVDGNLSGKEKEFLSFDTGTETFVVCA